MAVMDVPVKPSWLDEFIDEFRDEFIIEESELNDAGMTIEDLEAVVPDAPGLKSNAAAKPSSRPKPIATPLLSTRSFSLPPM